MVPPPPLLPICLQFLAALVPFHSISVTPSWGKGGACSPLSISLLFLGSFRCAGLAQWLPDAQPYIIRAVDAVAPLLLKSARASGACVAAAALAPAHQVGRGLCRGWKVDGEGREEHSFNVQAISIIVLNGGADAGVSTLSS